MATAVPATTMAAGVSPDGSVSAEEMLKECFPQEWEELLADWDGWAPRSEDIWGALLRAIAREVEPLL